VASQLRKAGITPKTVFLSWHTSPTDLILLRELLASGGYNDILPSNENCILLIPNIGKAYLRTLQARFFLQGSKCSSQYFLQIMIWLAEIIEP
jgi:hypothetical protein